VARSSQKTPFSLYNSFIFRTLRPSTFVERPLQIHPFYAKQTQFPKSQMNVKPYNTTDYENIANWTLGENKPNTNPIQTQSCPPPADSEKPEWM